MRGSKRWIKFRVYGYGHSEKEQRPVDGKKTAPLWRSAIDSAVRPPTPVTDRVVDKALRAVSDCPSTDMAAQPPSPSMMSRLAFGTSGAPSAALVRCQPLHACPSSQPVRSQTQSLACRSEAQLHADAVPTGLYRRRPARRPLQSSGRLQRTLRSRPRQAHALTHSHARRL